jgi:hypothetical protein
MIKYIATGVVALVIGSAAYPSNSKGAPSHASKQTEATSPQTNAKPQKVRERVLSEKEKTPAIGRAAMSICKQHCSWGAIGTKFPFTLPSGERYVGRIERHWHDPNGTVRPLGSHPGVTVYRLVSVD